MIPTANLIAGEVALIERQITFPFVKMYSKTFHKKTFVQKVGQQLSRNHIEWLVKMQETDEDWVLKINTLEVRRCETDEETNSDRER